MILTIEAIVLEPAEFSVSATAEHAVFPFAGLDYVSQKLLYPKADYRVQHFGYS